MSLLQHNNNSTGSGAAVYLEDSNVTFIGGSFLNNHAQYYGGAIKSENSEINLISVPWFRIGVYFPTEEVRFIFPVEIIPSGPVHLIQIRQLFKAEEPY